MLWRSSKGLTADLRPCVETAKISVEAVLTKAQSKLCRGESILETAPQFSLQCYIVLFSLTPLDWKKWISVILIHLNNNTGNVAILLEAFK